MLPVHHRQGRRWFESLILVALVAIFLWDSRLADPRNFIGGVDVELAHYWYKTYLRGRLQSFALPLWAPQFFSGHPFLAYPEMCVFYPTTVLFVLLPIPLAFTLNYAIHLLIAAAGARAVLRLFTPSRSAGLVSASCYAFGGYMADRLHSGHITYVQSAAWLPWVFYALHRAHQSGSLRDRVVAAVLFALLVLASPPHNAMYGVILMVVQTVAWNEGPGGARLRFRLLLDTVFVIGLGLLLSAVQVLPSAEFARLTDRMGASYEFATFLSFPPGNLTRLLVPRLDAPWVIDLDEYGVDVGAGGVVLAGVALVSRRVWSRAVVFPAASLFTLTLMLGKHLPFYAFYLQVFPLLGIFRAPARAELILNLTLAVMAGLAIDEVRRHRRSGGMRALGAGGLALLGIGVIAFLLGEWTVPVGRAGLAVVVVSALLVVVSAQRAPLVAGLIPLFIFAELYAAHHARVPVNDSRTLEQGLDFERLATPLGQSRVFVPFEPILDRGMRFGYEDVNGFAPIVLGRYYRFMVALSGATYDSQESHFLPPGAAAAAHPFLAQLLNVRSVLLTEGRWHDFMPSQILPRVRFVDHLVVKPDPADQLAALLDGTVDARTSAVVSHLPSRLATAPVATTPLIAPVSTAEVLVYAPERIEVRVSTDRPRLLVFSELNYPGWLAEVDGEPVPLITTNYAFRGVAVPAGATSVVLEFEPLSLVAGGVLSIAALGFVALVLYRTSGAGRSSLAPGQGRGRGAGRSATT